MVRWTKGRGVGVLALVIGGSGCASGANNDDGVFGSGLGGGPASASASADGGGGSGTTQGVGDGEIPTDGDSDGDGDSSTVSADTSGEGGMGCAGDDECDDADACTTDICEQGLCTHEAVVCNDGVLCTADVCDPTAGCQFMPDDAQCDDMDVCTGVEICDPLIGCQSGTPVVCDDGDPCTMDVCDATTGGCSTTALEACNAGDGCCPLGCSAAVDGDCVCTNSAPSATTASNGGGLESTGYGPSNWNDGVDEAACVAAACQMCFGWIENNQTPSGAFARLTWPTEQTIGSMFVQTSDAASGQCAPSVWRNIEDATVQYWNGAAWVNAATIVGQSGDIALNFDPPLVTTQLRMFDVTSAPGGLNSLIYEWSTYAPLDCAP